MFGSATLQDEATILNSKRFPVNAKGDNTPYDVVLADIKERDYRDTHRDIAPLKQAEDAVYLDTSNMTIEEAAAKVVELAKAAR